MSNEYRGYNGFLILSDSGAEIKRGIRGFLLGGGYLRGNKSFPYSSIVAVQLKKAGVTAGYIQLTLSGGSDSKRGLFESVSDENSIHFHALGDNNQRFMEAKLFIEARIGRASDRSTRTDLDDLEKLAGLKEKGIISEAEFSQKKKQLLGL